jgi:glycosyltransferase involved in cell wall biosynthesis
MCGREKVIMKILTDIRIPQSDVWSSRTTFIEDLFGGRSGHEDGYDGAADCLYHCFNILRVMRQYDVIVTADLRIAQFVAMAKRLLRIRKPRQIILELMLDEARPSALWRAKVRMQRMLLSAADVVFVSSTAEVDSYSRRFGLTREKFRFLPFHTNVVEPRCIATDEGYVFTAGKTGRDFRVFADAMTGTGWKGVVVSDRYHVDGVEFPPDVRVEVDVSYARYMELLEGASVVVVPLLPLVKSTGQVVLLEAMALGKPVIATSTVGTRDYIDDNVNGLLVPPGDAATLREAIRSVLGNRTLRDRIVASAMKRILSHHTYEAYIDTILGTAAALADGPARATAQARCG